MVLQVVRKFFYLQRYLGNSWYIKRWKVNSMMLRQVAIIVEVKWFLVDQNVRMPFETIYIVRYVPSVPSIGIKMILRPVCRDRWSASSLARQKSRDSFDFFFFNLCAHLDYHHWLPPFGLRVWEVYLWETIFTFWTLYKYLFIFTVFTPSSTSVYNGNVYMIRF